MSTVIITLLILIAVFIGLPTLVYICMKMGTAGYLRGREMFIEREKENGKEV